jgi:hypothetical protein
MTSASTNRGVIERTLLFRQTKYALSTIMPMGMGKPPENREVSHRVQLTSRHDRRHHHPNVQNLLHTLSMMGSRLIMCGIDGELRFRPLESGGQRTVLRTKPAHQQSRSPSKTSRNCAFRWLPTPLIAPTVCASFATTVDRPSAGTAQERLCLSVVVVMQSCDGLSNCLLTFTPMTYHTRRIPAPHHAFPRIVPRVDPPI